MEIKLETRTSIDYGFRLPSSLDNRPLNLQNIYHPAAGLSVYTSATQLTGKYQCQREESPSNL